MSFTWWLRRTKQQLTSARRGARGTKSRRPAYRPAVEVMEDRVVPASRLFAVAPGTQLAELNPATGVVINSFAAPETASGANGLAFDGTRLFYINGGGSDRLFELNPNTGAVIDNDLITVGSGSYDGLAVVAGQVYIQDFAANQIHVFDPVSDTVVRTITVAADLQGGLAGASNPGALIGPINGGNLIAEINPTTGAVTNTFQPGFPNLFGAAVVGNEIYLGSGASPVMFRYTRAGTFLGQVPLPFPVAALASDDTTPVSPPAPGAQFVNGNFEAGNVSGWTVFNQQSGTSPGYQAYTGPNPFGSQLPAPPQGNFAAIDNNLNPGTYILYQDVALPAGQFHTLSLQAYYNNFAGQFVTPNTLGITNVTNQQFRIDVITPSGSLTSTDPGVVLLNVFRTNTNDPNFRAPTTLSADLTPFAGQTVRLRIAVAATINALYGAVDDVKLTSTGTAPTGTVSGVKFNDANGNGTRETGEPGLPGWTIYADVNNNRRLDAGEPSAVTDANGAYTLTVAPGTYTFREVAQAGWVQTAPAADRLFSARVGATGAPQIITEYNAAGGVLATFNGPANVSFQGPQGLAFSGDSLFYINGEQQPTGSTGVHTLFEIDPATGAVFDSDALPATQEIAGLAYLGGLVYVQVHTTNQVLVFDPATDTVVRTFTVPADLEGGMTGAAELGLLFASNRFGQIFAINPQTGAVVRTLLPNVGPLVGGLAYYRGELVAANAGPTVFRVDPQTGAVLGTVNLTGPGGPISGLAGDGKVGGGQRLTVAAGQTITLNFGNRLDVGTVSGVKFNDANGNGTRETGEPGLPGWTIYADVNNNRRLDAGEPSAVTGADGSYTLVVPTGLQTIREVAQAGWLQTSPLSHTLYATSFNGDQLVTVNTATGTATPVGPFGFTQTSSLATAPDGTLWTVVNPFSGDAARLARVDPATGAATPIGGSLGIVGGAVRALEADAAGNLYAATSDGRFYRLNTTTGAATLVGSLGVPEPVDLAFDPSGALWMLRSGSLLYRVDPATGAAAFVTPVTVTGSLFGLSIHPGTGTFYLTSTASVLYTLDPVTGLATRVGSNLVPTFFGSDFVTNNGHSVTVTAGAILGGLNFGDRRDEGTVSGVKYEDANGNGTRDAGEAGLPGWTIYADLNNNGRLDAGEPSAVTDANGSYQLTLGSGSRTIREVPQAGFVQTGPGDDRVYALRSTSSQTLDISELDPFGFVTNTFPAPAPVAQFGLQGLAVGRNSLFYIDGSQAGTATRTLYELDSFTGAVIDSDPVNVLGGQVTGLGYLDGLVYVLGGGNQIVVFNPVTDSVVRTMTVPGPTLFGGLTGAADLGLLFATSGAQIAAIDPVTGTVVRTLFTSAGSLIGGLAYRTGELLGVPLLSSPFPIARIDPVTGAVRGQLAPVGPNASGLGGDGPHPGAARVAVTPGAALVGRDFGAQRIVPPVAADDAATTNEDTPLTAPARALLANDGGQFGAKAVVAVNGVAANVGQTRVLPSGSLLRVNSDGSYTYTPAGFQSLPAGATATDSFTYTMADGVAATATATVRITITGVNDAPVANPNTFMTNEDTAVGGNILANDTDVDLGDTRSVIEVNGSAAAVGQTVTLPSGARLTVQANGGFVYDPSGAFDQLAAGQTASDGFTYRIADAAGATSNSALVTINLTGVNDAPTAVSDTGATDEDTPLAATAPGVIGNDTDLDTGDTRAVTAVNGSAAAVGQTVTLASGARFTLRADGSYDYDPTGAFDFLLAGQTALDTVAYTMADGAGATSTATLTITVTGVNDRPVAVDDATTVNEDFGLGVAAPGVLGNDRDPDRGDTRAVTAVNGSSAVGQPVTLASGATVTVYADGSYAYEQNGVFDALGSGQTATDSFTYTTADAAGATSTATVTITIRGVNDAPVANADAFETDEDFALIILTGDVLANDTDVDGGPLTATPLSDPANGTVTVNPDGSFTYTPNADFNGTDTFTYVVSDGRGGEAVGTVTITVRPVNDAPTLAEATFTVAENSPDGTAVGTVAGFDVDGDALTYQIVGGNTAGAFAIDPDTGEITVANVAALDFETTPTFTLTVEVRDPSGLTATATVTVNLSDVITPPRIDILPSDPNNRINSKKKGKISVAILSAPEFDARLVDIGSLRFGRTGQEDSISRHPTQGPRFRFEDVNGDGLLDLVVDFEVEKTGFRPGDTRGILTGRLTNGFVFSVEDVVSVT